MKKFIMILALVATSAFAEPSFNQVQDLIGRQQYSAAEQGLEQIIKNHPNSAKAYYSMAQAQAGLGNLDKARYALDKATGLDPTLAFASQSQVQSLREAIAPQVHKIEVVDDSHWFRNLLLLVVVASIAWIVIAHYRRKRDEDDGDSYSFNPVTPSPTPSPVKDEPVIKSTKSEVYKPKAETKKVEVPPRGKETTVKYSSYTPTPTPVQPTHTTTVVNQSNDGLLTGMLIGNMLSSHHDRVIERETVREVPSRSSESSSSRSSSWDSDSSSSSWDSDSSSSSSKSSSWDSDSSSSSSWSSSDSSSSSWDSGSSSSDSSW